MAEMHETSPRAPIQNENDVQDHKTPPPLNQPNNLASTNSAGINSGKSLTPDRLNVPKAFKYPERYSSPTELIMSPITKGLLARSRKANVLFPPSRTTPPKLTSFQHQEMGVSQS